MTQAESIINVENITALTVKLAQLLATENSYLQKMEIKKLDAMQKEKSRMITALENMKKEIRRNPAIKDSFSREGLEELASVSKIFTDILKENHARLKVAREVNSYVIKTMHETLSNEIAPPKYDGKGSGSQITAKDTLSMALNDLV